MAGVVFDSLTGFGNGTDSAQASQSFAIDADQIGNSYVTGTFSGTIDFAPNEEFPNGTDTLTSRGGRGDIFVAKYTPSGTLAWVVSMGSPDADTLDKGVAIEIGADGSVFVGGEFSGSANFGNQTLIATGSGDAFLTKLSANGLFQWSKSWGTSDFDSFVGLDLDSSGNVLVASSQFSGALSVKKFGTTGTAVWTKNIAANVKDSGDLAVDAAGNVFVSGNFSGTVDFDPSNKTSMLQRAIHRLGLESGFVLSLNSSGNFRWVSPFLARASSTGFIGSAQPTSLAVDNQGNVLAGGYRSGLVDFQASSATYEFPYDRGGFLVNLSNTNGYLRWAKSFDASGGTAYVDDIDLDLAGNIYLAGAYSGVVDFDPSAGLNSRPSVGNTDAYYMKLGSTGEPVWFETLEIQE